MLMPKKVKFRKQQRGRMRGKAWRGGEVAFGDFGLKAIEPCWLTDRQIEAARVAMTRFIARGGKIWVRVFPDKPITKKPQETRMGKGKGAPEQWVAVVRPGRVLFDMEGVELEFREDALRAVARKAMHRKTGARGLRTILENVLLDTMYELPSMAHATKVVVDDAVVTGETKPYVIYESDEPAAVGDERR